MATPTDRPAKPKLYKMVSVPKVSGGATIKVGGTTIAGGGTSLNGIIKAMNSLGATVNSVAIITESIAKQTQRTIATEIRQQSELIRRQERLRKTKVKTDREKEDRKRKEAQRQRDAESEKKSEAGGKFLVKFTKFATAAAGGFFQGLATLLGGLFRAFVVTAVLDWIVKPGNTDKVVSIIKGIVGIFKVFQRLLSFGVTSALEGLAKVIDNPISFKGLFGAVQFIVGAAILMKGMKWMMNPASLAKDFVSVLSFVAKGMINLKKGVGVYGAIKKLASTRVGKYAMAGAVGVGAGMGSALLGGTKEEAIGTGIGAAAGTIGGEMLGTALGGEAGGKVGAAAGGLVGGLVGGPVGRALKPVTDAIGKFFGLIGQILKPVFDFVMNIGKEYFSAVGDLIQAVVNLIEPHKETLSFIAKGSLFIAFMPLIMMMKAITSLIRLFVPKGSADRGKSGTPKRAMGGPVVVPKMASGGMIGNTVMANPITQQLQQALSNAILLPFKAVGIGLISAMAMVGSVFGAFLPGPMQMLLGSVLAPIASMFGVPNSVFKKVSGFALKGIKNAGQAVVGFANTASDALSDLFDGNRQDSVNGLLSKILDAVMKMGGHTTPKASIGGAIPQAASGGWINGPMSGYPVSLDGGRSTAFIGHGREWVGFKGRAAGGGAGSAFVIPFNTPATVRTPSLTSMRMSQARAGGYALPRSIGGVVPQFATGGEFDPAKYREGIKSSDRVKIRSLDKSYVFGYTVGEDAQVNIKQLNKYTGGFGSNDLVGVQPGSPEWKKVVNSTDAIDWFKSHSVPAIKSSQVKVKVDPQADLGYWYNQAYQTHYNDWKKKGLSHSEASTLAAKAAKEFAISKKAGSLLPGAKGGSAPADLKNIEVASGGDQLTPTKETDAYSSAQDALSEALKKWKEAFGPNTGDQLDKQSKDTKSAQERAQMDATKAAANKLSATATTAAANVANAKPQAAGAIPLNSSGERPSPDINPFLRSQFGVVSQANYAPQNIVV